MNLQFRVWDKKYKRWLKDNEYSLENNNHLRLYNCVAEFVDSFYCGVDDSRFIIQQYTGLQDSCGVDIYEGDIVEWQTLYSKNSKTQLQYREPVIFDHGVFWVDLPLYEVNEVCKVVGHINE